MQLLTISFIFLWSMKKAVFAIEDPIAFSAVKGVRNGPYIAYQALLLNSNAEFREQYGVFKCVEPGLYYFSFSVLSQRGKDLRVSLRVNRIPICTVFSGSLDSYNMGSSTALLKLEKDDIVYLFIEEGEIYESSQLSRSFTTFSGFQISKSNNGGFFSSLMGRGNPVPRTNSGGFNNTIIAEIDETDEIYKLLNETSN